MKLLCANTHTHFEKAFICSEKAVLQRGFLPYSRGFIPFHFSLILNPHISPTSLIRLRDSYPFRRDFFLRTRSSELQFRESSTSTNPRIDKYTVKGSFLLHGSDLLVETRVLYSHDQVQT